MVKAIVPMVIVRMKKIAIQMVQIQFANPITFNVLMAQIAFHPRGNGKSRRKLILQHSLKFQH